MRISLSGNRWILSSVTNEEFKIFFKNFFLNSLNLGIHTIFLQDQESATNVNLGFSESFRFFGRIP